MTPAFLQASAGDLASWREVPLTKAFAEYLDVMEAMCADSIIAHVRAGKGLEAQVLSGKLEAIQQLKAVVWERALPVASPDEDDDFRDPAALERRR